MKLYVIKIYKKVRDKFAGFKMHKKMIIAYSVPVLLAYVIISLVFSPRFISSYDKELKKTVNQANMQAINFISNYTKDMVYVNQLVAENSKINTLLSECNFYGIHNPAEAYREFMALDNAFAELDLSNDTYHIGIYLPDRVAYSNNNYYFFPESELESREDYQDMIKMVENGQLYFANIVERRSFMPSEKDNYIALFQEISIQNKNGVNQKYITKVEVLTSEFQRILVNSVGIDGSLAFILDQKKQLVAASDFNIYDKLMNDQSFSGNIVQPWEAITLKNQKYYQIYSLDEKTSWTLYTLIPVKKYRQQMNFVWYIIFLFFIFMGIIVIITSYLLAKYFTNRLSRLTGHMKTLEKGDLNVKFPQPAIKSGDEIDEIYRDFNFMTDEIQNLLKEHYRLGKKVTATQLSALQAQINPHFLYNTLDLINWGAMDYGAQKVAQLAKDLGQFYRLSLNHGHNVIMIRDELKHVQAYVNIENVHFGGAINLLMDVPDQILDYSCLNIILQPFVENAIVHGIAEIPDIMECNISISAELVENEESRDIVFYIQDDGPGMEVSLMKQLGDVSLTNYENGYGVRNINFRIKLCYGDAYGVAFTRSDAGGTKVTVRIKAMSAVELENAII